MAFGSRRFSCATSEMPDVNGPPVPPGLPDRIMKRLKELPSRSRDRNVASSIRAVKLRSG
jgi:hypothetical protein